MDCNEIKLETYEEAAVIKQEELAEAFDWTDLCEEVKQQGKIEMKVQTNVKPQKISFADEEMVAVEAVEAKQASLSWNPNLVVILDRIGRSGFRSWIWKYFGTLRDKLTGSSCDDNHVYCKICVEEKHSIRTK